MPTIRTTLSPDERGSVLLIGLLFLLVVSALAITASRMSGLDERVSANSHRINITFQAAESAIESIIEEGNGNLDINNVLAQSMMAITQRPADGSSYDMADAHVESRGIICYDGEGIAPGFSLGEGTQNFTAHRFKFRGRGEIPDINSRSTNLQGARIIGPGSDSSPSGNCL
ncbi:MAG: pilus assembly PilX N-terminal domain-containing protein [Magnetococcales bacterium]|nr:pilus assembly PilX N-terminal domain-containing protein [Magnetococcales bacterium]